MEQDRTVKPLQEVEEGPYYRQNSPLRNVIAIETTPGEKLIISGKVLDTNGEPVANAWLDFWHADGTGVYDNDGYKLRGHQYSKDDGSFRLETVVPGPYGNRAPHVHVIVKTPNSRVFTTQLFFPFNEANAKDPIFEPANVMSISDTVNGKVATFDIVIETN